MKTENISLWSGKILRRAFKDTLVKLNPAHQWKNPVMFIVLVGSIWTSVDFIAKLNAGNYSAFTMHITLWLWFTVLFANFSEAIAEGQGKARADSMRKARVETIAHRLGADGKKEESVEASQLKKDDLVIIRIGEIIPADGEVVSGVASVDESVITGESAPVIRESGGDRSAVTGGTKVLSDEITIRVTSETGSSFLDKMISMIEGAKRQKTPNEIALQLVLSGLTLVFLVAVVTLYGFAEYSRKEAGLTEPIVTITVLIALLVCLIPTTIGALLSAIGISGMARLMKKNVITMSGRSVEASGDIDILLLDKTGTITLGDRQADSFIPNNGVTMDELVEAASLSSLADQTPEGRSIVVKAKHLGVKETNLHDLNPKFIPFSAHTRMSGVDLIKDGNPVAIRKGAVESIKQYLVEKGTKFPEAIDWKVKEIAQSGATPLMVCSNEKILGIIVLKDIIKGGIRERFARLRQMGIRTVMITGDNPLTAAAIAAEAGVDDFISQANPETKLIRLREEQAKGKLVGMIGDGTNDAPALAQADVGVVMNTGTQTAREAGNMIDLDSNPTKLIEIVEVGKQLLMTRGSLTTFSIANDVAKYFAILPALFSPLFATATAPGPLNFLNVMRLATPQSAILSAVIFNALIIIALVPLALKGVKYRPEGANKVLARNLLVYGLGGLIAPFIGIKIIDVILHQVTGI